MDKETQQLRDLFVDVTNEDTVTESQDPTGTAPRVTPDTAPSDDLATVIMDIQDETGFTTQLTTDELVTLVTEYFAGASDYEIAEILGDTNRDKVVTRARINLHLFRDRDFDAPFDLAEFETQIENGLSIPDCAEQLGISRSTAWQYYRRLNLRAEAAANDHDYSQRLQHAAPTTTDTDASESATLDDPSLTHADLADAIDGANRST